MTHPTLDPVADYWRECVALGAEACGLTLTAEQIDAIAGSVQDGHEHYGMAFYSPPSTDRLSAIEGEWERRFKALEKSYNDIVRASEGAMKRALRVHRDDNISINEKGEVWLHNGRSTQIL